MRNRLALTTILAVAPFLSYGRQSSAACVASPSPTFLCSGANGVTQVIAADNADASTVPGFSVNTAAGDAITITGDGHLRFTDDNASAITGADNGLSMRAAGDAGATPGAITITANSSITGGDSGIDAYNEGSGDVTIIAGGAVVGLAYDGIAVANASLGGDVTIGTGAGSSVSGYLTGIRGANRGTGDLVITADGKVSGTRVNGIKAYGGPTSRDLKITTGTGSEVSGYQNGIDARSFGLGDLTITANGKVTASDGEGIHAFTTGRDLMITTGVDSDITGNMFGIRGRNDGTGDLAITVQGDVTGTVREGVYALAASSTANDVTVTVAAGSAVKGGYNGIEARSLGHGALLVAAYGDVTGTVEAGIWVVNYAGTSATVKTGALSHVTGYDGIAGRNDSGDFTITANGEVTGINRHGIYARNLSSGDLKITTGAASDVEGQVNGIDGRMIGAGDIEIIANGKVTGTEVMGIYALGAAGAGDMRITTGAGSTIAGFNFGITGMNKGTGDLTITANGDVTAQNGGVVAVYGRNFDDAGDITITTGAGSYLKGNGGIRLLNNAEGVARIDVGGQVNARFYGIDAGNGPAGERLEIITRAGSNVAGAHYGIFGRNAGGDFVITVAGDIGASAGHAILARNLDTADDLIVTVEATSTITAQSGGILANNRGTGIVEITVRGAVEGTDGVGIHAVSTPDGSGIRIATAAGSRVIGGHNGIEAFDESDVAIDITVDGDIHGTDENGLYVRNFGYGGSVIKIGGRGRVEGLVAGIDVASTGGETRIVNAGLITATNLLAINAKRARAEIVNSGFVDGRVDLTGGDDRFDNLAGGLWRTLGASFFGDGTDSVNNRGVLVAASGISEIENVYFDNLEFFSNSGTVSLVDGLAGDQLGLGPATEYVGSGGRLVVDAFLAPGAPGKSDLLLIGGNSSGTTNLVVNLTNPIGSAPNTDGIRVVLVSGNSAEQDFNVAGGVLNAGFFAWDLRRVEEGGDVIHELYTTGFGAGAYEFAAGITGAQDIWHQTTGTLLQRQADLRALLAGTQVTPVADFSEPVEPTPVGRVTPGLWFKGVGGYIERDQDVGNNAVTDRNQEIYGLFAGFDFGTESAGEAWMFGVFGGYVTSNLDFTSTDTKWDYEGPSVGAYATYLDHAFYADLTVKADFLDIDIDAGGIAPAADDVDSDVFNLGGQIDAGYKMPLEHGLFVEPQASLAVLHTEVDDIGDVMGGSVDFEDETSVRGRLSLRLGHELTAGNQVIYSSDITASLWQQFAGDNDVTVSAPLSDPAGISDDPGDTFGDVALGFSVQSPEGWSSFLRANYQFSDDYDAVAGTAGVRYAW